MPLSPRFIAPAMLATAASVGLLAHCGKPSADSAGGDSSEPALATVGGEVIHASDLQAEAEWRRANRRPVPSADDLLEEVVRRRALVQQARQAGLDDDPEVRRRLESTLIAALRRQQLEPSVAKVEISDEEVREAYEGDQDSYVRQGLDRLAILFLEADVKGSAERRAEVRERLVAGLEQADKQSSPGGRGAAAAGFGQVAIEFSDDQVSRHRGGDIGWIATDATESRLPAEVLTAGRALEKGERSGVIETDRGYYAVMKTDLRPGGRKPFEQVAADIRSQLLRDRRAQIETTFIESALDGAGVEIDQVAVEAIDLGSPDISVRRPPEFPTTPPGIPAPTADAE